MAEDRQQRLCWRAAIFLNHLESSSAESKNFKIGWKQMLTSQVMSLPNLWLSTSEKRPIWNRDSSWVKVWNHWTLRCQENQYQVSILQDSIKLCNRQESSHPPQSRCLPRTPRIILRRYQEVWVSKKMKIKRGKMGLRWNRKKTKKSRFLLNWRPP